jgi:hypothetical protein
MEHEDNQKKYFKEREREKGRKTLYIKIKDGNSSIKSARKNESTSRHNLKKK